MRRPLAVVGIALLLASCGKGGGSDERYEGSGSVANSVATDAASAPAAPPPPGGMRTFNAEERAAGPEINPTAAPGVAFNYSYAFRLEAERIAAVQERHASRCEQLGPARCRITGMLYRVRSETDIEARLQFKLDPSIARIFGREGVAVVAENQGMLVESQITGTDAGTQIRQAGRSIADLEADLARLEQRLAGQLSRADRERLDFEAQQLRQTIRASRQNREDVAETLATTPMTFVYGSGDLVPGFDTPRPFGDALEQAGDNFIDGVAVLFVILVTLLPWAFAALLGWFAYRAARRWRNRPAAAPAGTDRAAAAEPAQGWDG
ncbi:MAG TPA: hypothetical protein VGB79_04395 [Allosphingosinicella sp.]|jgi:hypothetical protein